MRDTDLRHLLSLLAAVLIGLLCPRDAQAAVNFFKVQHSGMCIDVPASSQTAGVQLTQWPCTGNPNQTWHLVPAGSPTQTAYAYYLLKNDSSGQCIDVPGSSTAAGTRVNQYPCHGGPNQQWRLQPAGVGYNTLVNRNSGLCIDVPASSTAAGALLIQWTCNATANQKFATTAANIASLPTSRQFFSFQGVVTLQGPCSGRAICQLDTREFVQLGGQLVETITAYGQYWNFVGDLPWAQDPHGSLSGVARYANGPCAGRLASCQFDTRTFVNLNGLLIESISAYGQYWNFVGDQPWPNDPHGFLASVARYANGPCRGQGGGCKFDSRTFVTLGGALVESISAYGQYWNFVGDQAWANDGHGIATDVPRYRNGPCAGQLTTCTFDTRTFAQLGGEVVESISANGRYWNFVGDQPWRDPTGLLNQVPRYGLAGDVGSTIPTASYAKFDLVAKSYIDVIGKNVGSICNVSFNLPGCSIYDPALKVLAGFTDVVFHESANNPLRYQPQVDPPTKGYRLYSSAIMLATYSGTRLDNLTLTSLDLDNGRECVTSLLCFDPPRAEGFQLYTDRINDSQIYFIYGMRGRPPDQVESVFQGVFSRTSVYIWHVVQGVVDTSSGTAVMKWIGLGGSRFPSHRLWVNQARTDELTQKNFDSLWQARDPLADPTTVR